MPQITFNPSDWSDIQALHQLWLEKLLTPPDGMWEALRKQGNIWKIFSDEVLIGFAVTNQDNQLIQFFIKEASGLEPKTILSHLIRQKSIKTALAGTHDKQFFSNAQMIAKAYSLHTFLFRNFAPLPFQSQPAPIQMATESDIEALVSFGQKSVGAPENWLRSYNRNWIKEEAIYMFKRDGELIGISEVRKNTSAPAYADLGIIVHPAFRLQGIGSYLLQCGAKIAQDKNLIPICSCEAQNKASFKAITKAGFTSEHQLFQYDF